MADFNSVRNKQANDPNKPTIGPKMPNLNSKQSSELKTFQKWLDSNKKDKEFVTALKKNEDNN
jgi:hypothetical protein